MISGVDTQLECLKVSVIEIPYCGCSCDILSVRAAREVAFHILEDDTSSEAYPESTNSTLLFPLRKGEAQELVTIV